MTASEEAAVFYNKDLHIFCLYAKLSCDLSMTSCIATQFLPAALAPKGAADRLSHGI
jgi:hypothetical protein